MHFAQDVLQLLALLKPLRRNAKTMVGLAVLRFGDHLEAVSELRPELSAKCQDLERQILDFARRLNGEPDVDEDLPLL